jgi:Family of unknown function (DUF6504)
MRAIRGEPVEVWLRHDRPARFVWRGRMYTVIFVLDRRLTAGAAPAEPDDPPPGDRECWRVEATPERAVPPARYELCYDTAADRWSLSRT